MIYQIKYADDFMYFVMGDLEVLSVMPDFNIYDLGGDLSFDWVTPPGEFIKSDNGSTKVPDVACWGYSNPVVNSKAHQKLAPFLNEFGEFLPVSVEGIEYFIYNLKTQLGNEVVDIDNCEVLTQDGFQIEVTKMALFSDRIDDNKTPVFTVEFDQGVKLFCGDRFKDLVESEGLKGLCFKPI